MFNIQDVIISPLGSKQVRTDVTFTGAGQNNHDHFALRCVSPGDFQSKAVSNIAILILLVGVLVYLVSLFAGSKQKDT